jgi:lipid A 3-O-deacylase
VRAIAALVVVLSALPFWAQNTSSQTNPMQKGTWELGAFVGGGTGFGKRSTTHFLYPGFRVGNVLTSNHGPGWLNGNFEWNAEVMPYLTVFQPPVDAHGFAFNPVILRWNFASNRRVASYAELTGGVLFTGNDVPFNTNNVNFLPGAGYGMHIFTAPRQAITWEARYLHVSNASLANHNSGINASIQFTLGYTWFK